MFEIHPTTAQQQAEFQAAADRVLARKDEAERLAELGFTALEVVSVSYMPVSAGTELVLEVPVHGLPVAYSTAQGGVYASRTLVVWQRDSSALTDDRTPAVELFGRFEIGGEVVDVQLETWTDQRSLADVLEMSEYLAAQDLRYTVAGRMGETVAY